MHIVHYLEGVTDQFERSNGLAVIGVFFEVSNLPYTEEYYYDVLNYRQLNCLLSNLFMLTADYNSFIRGNAPVTGGSPV